MATDEKMYPHGQQQPMWPLHSTTSHAPPPELQWPLPPPYEAGAAPTQVHVHVAHQPAPPAAAAADKFEGRWRYGLCECCENPGICLLTWCLQFVTEWLLAKQLGHPRYAWFLLLVGIFLTTPVLAVVVLILQLPLLTGSESGPALSAVTMPCLSLVITALLIVRFFILISQRQQIRDSRRIPGDCLGDCCVLYWCQPCSLCQMKQEADYMDRVSRSQQMQPMTAVASAPYS